MLLGCIGHAGGALNPPTPLVLGDLDPTRFATPPVPRGPKLGSERYPLVDPERGLCTTIGQSILAGDLRGSSSMPVTLVRAMAMHRLG